MTLKGYKQSEEHRRKIGEANRKRVVSEETKKKISEARKGKHYNKGIPKSEEHRRKLSEYHKGRHLSEETKKRLSQSMKGRVFSDEHKRKIGEANKRRSPFSEETRRKIGDAHKGLIFSEESRKKMSVSSKGRKHTDETKRKIGDNNRIRPSVKGWHHTEEAKEKIRKAVREERMNAKWPFPATKLEKTFANMLDSIGETYIDQYRFSGAAYDFYLPSCNMLIEVNGGFWHADPRFYSDDSLIQIQRKSIERDIEKLVIALEGGYNYLCFWEHDVKSTPDIVLNELRNEIACLGGINVSYHR